jgi:hypothetical protein
MFFRTSIEIKRGLGEFADDEIVEDIFRFNPGGGRVRVVNAKPTVASPAKVSYIQGGT